MSVDDRIRDGLESLVEPVDGDAVMSAIDDRARRAGPVDETAAPRRRRWPLAAVAAVLLLLAVAVGGWWFGGGRRTVHHVDLGPATDPPTSVPSSTIPDAGVTFLLVWSGATDEPAGSLRVADTVDDQARLLSGEIQPQGQLPVPRIPTMGSLPVLVAMTISHDGCPPSLDRFVVDGTTLTPMFRQVAGGSCAKGTSTTTYLVQLDWDSIGSSARFVLPADVSHAERTTSAEAHRPDPFYATGPLLHGRLELSATSMPAGGTLNGEVVIDNDTGAPITFRGCGTPVNVTLHGHGVSQGGVWPMCGQDLTFPVGESRWPVTVSATFGMCGESADPQVRRCVDGHVPPLPPGTYRAVATWSSDAFQLEVPAVTVTVTP
ncbi:MAG: hypothetical protein JST64_07010 [Actinobacteria bacterium]|nr:hypothetical protein [Actinomycetota bacterium]